MFSPNPLGKPLSFSTSAAKIPELRELLCRLPAFDLRDPLLRREPDYYGASKLIADSLDVPVIPVSRSTWIHGWGPFQQWKTAPGLDPAAVFGPRDPNRCHLLFTEEQVAFAETHGWADCHAVGAPFTYTSHSEAVRIPGSLLVMPPHMTEDTSHDWNEDDYVKTLNSLKSRFSMIVACVSAACVSKNYWTTTLDQAGIPWIVGASPRDRNGLKRMRLLFDSFEYVTSNQLGSLHAYAAYCGAKASLWGPEQCYTKEQFKDDRMWQRYPEGLEVILRESRHERSRQRFPFLFCDPDQAVELVDWAAEELGENCKRSPEEMARLLGWHWKPGQDEKYQRLFMHSYSGRFSRRIYAIEKKLRGIIGRE